MSDAPMASGAMTPGASGNHGASDRENEKKSPNKLSQIFVHSRLAV